ncbi:MAG TPA: GNAT family N-acetyltransferase, partial [Thermoplasmata archaeon]|nr:GNAT family N-acetyltransferase [Thermoplasmata archaeon]
RVGPYTPISFEQFEGHQDRPGSMPEGFFLACDGESYVGMTDLEVSRARPDAWMVGFTGTRAAYRGRGIASEIKRRAVEFSREQGIRYLRTFNDSLNLRMWAINERLGFRRTVEWSQRERQLTPSRAPARTP